MLPVHFPICKCPGGPVVDYRLREFKNGTLHIYKVCTACGVVAPSPVKRETVSLQKWRELLIESGREVVSL